MIASFILATTLATPAMSTSVDVTNNLTENLSVAAPQGFKQAVGPTTLPSGGTPEPASVLLLGGGALTYLGLRRRKRNSKPAE